MRLQKVSVDIWKMFYGSCSYLLLAFAFLVFLKLVNGCFWLPTYLKKSNEKLREIAKQDALVLGNDMDNHEKEKQDKKNV